MVADIRGSVFLGKSLFPRPSAFSAVDRTSYWALWKRIRNRPSLKLGISQPHPDHYHVIDLLLLPLGLPVLEGLVELLLLLLEGFLMEARQ
jgi:hypothetical protein